MSEQTVIKSHLTRRGLLRGVMVIGTSVAGAVLLAACTPSESSFAEQNANGPSPSAMPGRTGTIPPDLTEIPASYWSPAQVQGSLVELRYDTFDSMSYMERTRTLSKRAIVYLPPGYTEEERYDVFYLMHGGWGNETSTLGTPDEASEFTNVLDNAIQAREIEPLIVVCPTYNNTSPEDSADFSLALTLNENYHRELLNDLLPAVESTYSTYTDDVAPAGLMASRDHRGFGGFSMGAVATWRTFQHALDYFRYFLPMSCGTSLDMETILSTADGRAPDDYFVWAITGTDDFAHPYDTARVDLMRSHSSFIEETATRPGNFAFRVKDGYAHDGIAATEYTYNGLRGFWQP